MVLPGKKLLLLFTYFFGVVMSSSDSEGGSETPRITCKRIKNTEAWKQNVAKWKNSGEVYTYCHSKQQGRAWHIKTPYQCSEKCFTCIGDDNIKQIFELLGNGWPLHSNCMPCRLCVVQWQESVSYQRMGELSEAYVLHYCTVWWWTVLMCCYAFTSLRSKFGVQWVKLINMAL